ncbi:ABC transporter ATP-binding protein [Microbacterium soli]|uniref:ABC transporter ATP-binding protein n=1 Tax=Microbacterium soli TaxID=446075 RepID=A0ABP7MY20_9MICO
MNRRSTSQRSDGRRKALIGETPVSGGFHPRDERTGEPEGESIAPLLRVGSLTVTFGFGAHAAVRGVSFDVKAGERVAIVGESGSGKSTVCNAIAGFLRDDGTSIDAAVLEFEGKDLRGRRRTHIPVRTPGMTMVFQDAMTSLDPVWTIRNQLKSAIVSGGGVRRRDWLPVAEEALRRVGLTDVERILRARPYELSGGMRQRVMLAIALSGRPRMLIADEPTSALDATLSKDVMELMVELTEESEVALLLISHDISLCREYTDRLLIMFDGELVEDLSAAGADTARHPYTRGLLNCVPTLDNYKVDRLPTIQQFVRSHKAEDVLLVEGQGNDV